ncbi:MAG: MgtC/SapB family protein [Clostridiales bacterium]|nr:MgtC/SapB family protein [Clostridiales bacterium]
MDIDLIHINIYSITLRLFLAALIGAFIGYERGQHHQAAGLRTHMLICIGAALAMLTNQYISEKLFLSSDPARFGAQVISGIGFLGIGTIIVTGRQKVRGLTTAAGLWASACAGLAVGIGFYVGAILGGILIFAIITVLYGFDASLKNKSRYIYIYMEMREVSFFEGVKQFIENKNIFIDDINMERIRSDSNSVGITLALKRDSQQNRAEFIQELMSLPGVNFIQSI